MNIVFCQLLFLIGFFMPINGIDWRNPMLQINKVRSALKEQVEKIKESMKEKVEVADMRLMRKDFTRSPESNPLLPSAPINAKQAASVFETGWVDFYTWVSDLDSEYKPIKKADKLFFSTHYNSTMDTLLILHDRCGNARDHTVLKVIEALKLRNFDVNYNIFLLDYDKFMCNMAPENGMFKLALTPQLQLLAVEIGGFIFKGIRKDRIRADQINILGLGLSTHLAALVAKRTKILTDDKINSILGLDPPVRLRRSLLDRDAANHIHIYHTFKIVPGTRPITGHATADFVFGGAKRGPQCKNSLTSSCYKGFGVQLFVATLLFPKLFPGRWCPDYNKFSEHFCDSNEYSYVSFPPDKSSSGTYEMEINYVFPFGKGFDGIYGEEEEEDKNPDSGEYAKMSDQEYFHRLEMAVSRIRGDMVSCIHGVLAPTAVMRCVMAAQPSVKRLVNQRLIRKVSCEVMERSPTGKKCNYETRTHNHFELPF